MTTEYFKFQEDVTYNNPNLGNSSKENRFYSSTYKRFFEECSNYDNATRLFQYFSIESILKGTTLFSFCRYFSSNSADKFIKNINGLESEFGEKVISNIYCSINSIDNPFLKELVIDEILPDSYYNDYIYNETNYTAGKNDIGQWCDFIKDYCSVLCEIERKIYPPLLAELSEVLDRNKDNALIAYENFFSKSIYDFKHKKDIPPSRSKRFPQLLRTLLVATSNDRNPYVFNNLP